ncbi:hypothetical protein rpr22_0048 [Rickettsia prowazekii str. Rp22]|uniref:Uncharacterized protein n=1 Tax=Rickettsia prowazekii (strain Rp22) TaxID=449216 RepID=D5AVW9_RICPP|nr:hypothetical protein rpr22_0048 [Rickettsia prowazekii str. Rp22]
MPTTYAREYQEMENGPIEKIIGLILGNIINKLFNSFNI